LKTKSTTDVSKQTLVRRLRRIEGQIRGIEKMINEDRDCVDLVIQLAAVRSGIEGIGAIVLNNCMILCLNKDPNANADIDSLSKAISIWGRVRSGE
jgi:CsoR family transcriptional regulator, copper-sensing transcriptional repressor